MLTTRRSYRNHVTIIRLVAMVALFSACGGDGRSGLVIPDGRIRDTQPFSADFTLEIGAAPDSLPVDADGPLIEVLVPSAGQTIVGSLLTVQAKITDEDGVDAQSVKLTLQGTTQEVVMGLTSTPNVYEGLLDVTKLGGLSRLWIVAADLLGNENSTIVEFIRDPGPVIVFRSPQPDSRHKGSVSVEVQVSDPVPLQSFEVRLKKDGLPLTKVAEGANSVIYATTIIFDESIFGDQVITAEAINENGASTVVDLNFAVDNDGPTITVVSPKVGELVAGVMKIEVEVDDPAGLPPTEAVKVTVGADLDDVLILKPDSTSPSTFKGQYDTGKLGPSAYRPVVGVRATDRLNNESHYGYVIRVDNGQPIVELDPQSTDFFAARFKDNQWECSYEFDPVGSDAVNDFDRVPDTAEIRSRIEDRGNFVPSADWRDLAGVNSDTVWLYVLEDISKPLVVDSTGDGFCDMINPELRPVSSSPRPGEAVGVNLEPIPVGGAADYTMGNQWRSSRNNPGCAPGSDPVDDDPPVSLCLTTPMTIAIPTTVLDTPAIWTIPPVVAGDDVECVGQHFDFLANGFSPGWVCVAVEARDNVGNLGVSQPLRLLYDNTTIWRSPTTPAEQVNAPNCTGTIAMDGTVTNAPCTFRDTLPIPTGSCPDQCNAQWQGCADPDFDFTLDCVFTFQQTYRDASQQEVRVVN